MVAYYILAVSFGLSCAAISAYAIWLRKGKTEDSFPGSLYVPIMIVGVVFAAATLAAAIVGSGNEGAENTGAKAEHGALVQRG